MVKAKSGHLVETWQRRERGTAVPLSLHRIKLRDGSSAEVHGIDLTNADIPDKSYFGESCGVDYSDDLVRVMFAQPKLGGDGLRSLVLITMTPPAAAQFGKSLEKMTNPSLESLVGQTKITDKALSKFPTNEPEQTAALIADMVAVAVHGQECCLDFYHANAFSHLAAQRANASQLYLEPVVRVTTSSGLLLSLMRRLKQLRSQFPASIDIAEEEEHAD